MEQLEQFSDRQLLNQACSYGPDALRSGRELRRRLAIQERMTVRKMRQEGCSWAVIAQGLGVTRQAAMERFSSVDLMPET